MEHPAEKYKKLLTYVFVELKQAANNKTIYDKLLTAMKNKI